MTIETGPVTNFFRRNPEILGLAAILTIFGANIPEARTNWRTPARLMMTTVAEEDLLDAALMSHSRGALDLIEGDLDCPVARIRGALEDRRRAFEEQIRLSLRPMPAPAPCPETQGSPVETI